MSAARKLNPTFNKFKDLVKKYWYIAIPAHVGTSTLWFGSFYGATKVGLDFVRVLEKTTLPEKYIEPLKRGNMGNLAQAFLLYKLVTPLRYASTLAVTGSAIRYLKRRGMVK